MRIFVSVKTNAKEAKVERIDDAHFKVWVKASPVEGKANEAVIKLMSAFLDIAPSMISIKSGHASKQKCLEVA